MTYFSAYDHIYRKNKKNPLRLWLLVIAAILIISFFLPWTQNIRARGTVTSLRLEYRAQEINTVIGGRIDKWYVKEGDYVQKGDTLLRLSEIKEDYLDPDLLLRTSEQLAAKKSSVNYYEQKISAAQNQIKALENTLQAKLNQLDKRMVQVGMKIVSDSMDLIAAENDFNIAKLQFARQRNMHDSGLVSLTQLEARNQSYQASLAKKVSAQNKLLATRQEKNIIQIEYSALQQEYAEKVSKTEGEKFGSLSMAATGRGDISKLQNQYAGYAIRNGMYHIIAPQSGQVIKARVSGIGEVVKEGEMLIHIVPDQADHAVEMYVRPVDLPLISAGQKVRFIFDGFPAIVFSGWPQASYGSFAGIVSAIESEVSSNGKFKVLIREDASYRKWPEQLKMGTGANGIALLKNVPLWYELWRNINSFPPDYYKPKKYESEK